MEEKQKFNLKFKNFMAERLKFHQNVKQQNLENEFKKSLKPETKVNDQPKKKKVRRF